MSLFNPGSNARLQIYIGCTTNGDDSTQPAGTAKGNRGLLIQLQTVNNLTNKTGG